MATSRKRTTTPRQRKRVVIKLREELDSYRDGIEDVLTKTDPGPWVELNAKLPGIRINRAIRSVSPKRLEELIDRAKERTGRRSPLMRFFVVDLPEQADADEVAGLLRTWSEVESVQVYPQIIGPVDHDSPAYDAQDYLEPAPKGLAVRCAWQFNGGDGQGQRVAVAEGGWDQDHAALPAEEKFNEINDQGENSGIADHQEHGTNTLGVICASPSGTRCVGIANQVSEVAMSSWAADVNLGSTPQSYRPVLIEAIAAAASHMQEGEVLLIEAEHSDVDGVTGPLSLVPAEAVEAQYEEVVLAVGNGLVVIEPAGNGDHRFDDLVANYPWMAVDSGAIVVGAMDPGTGERLSGPVDASNRGARVDCHAHGASVGTLRPDDNYYDLYGGTSGAAAVIAGAAVALQGLAENSSLGRRLTSEEMREFFHEFGTESLDPPNDEIGKMPDLAKIMRSSLPSDPTVALGLEMPEVYTRDHVGDTGDPHSGPIAVSPDVIVLQSERDPADFEEGKGNEDDDALSEPVIESQDHWLYVRVRNRGTKDANAVKVRVYWAEPSTLVLPDKWTLIGEEEITNVPANNELTVSDPIPWAVASVPGKGHYCFIAHVEGPCSSTDPFTTITDWHSYRHFIKNQNNVTWRNFNVVELTPPSSPGGSESAEMEMAIPGPPDQDREMRIEIDADLPDGARIEARSPTDWLAEIDDDLGSRQPDSHGLWMRMALPGPGRHTLAHGRFPRGSRGKLRLRVELPSGDHSEAYRIAVRHLDRDEEVGRVTWLIRSRPVDEPGDPGTG